MLKRVVTFTILLGILSGCVSVDPKGRGYSVAIPMSMINSTLAEKFPASEKVSYGVVSGTLDIKKPNVLGKSGTDKLGVGTSFKFTNMLIPNGINGTINLASGLRFDATTKNLYLAKPMVNEIKFQDFSLAKYLTEDMRKAIGVVIANSIAKKPVYNIEKAGVGANFVKAIDIRNGQVYLTFGLY